MIVGAWRARASRSNPLAYASHFRRDVLPTLLRAPGFLGATFLRADRGATFEYLVLTRWTSIDAIRGFAGADFERAVVHPEAARTLLDFETTVSHYEVLDEVPAASEP